MKYRKLVPSKKSNSVKPSSFFYVLVFFLLVACQHSSETTTVKQKKQPLISAQWEQVAQLSDPVPRHEASLVAHDNKLYLLGGRRVNPTDVFDPNTNRWESRAKPPLEIHHFQAAAYGDDIYILGAFTGGFPNEQPIDRVIKYTPETDTFHDAHVIPEDRRRGGAATAVYQGKIYVIGGITEGHMRGTNAWFDSYDPKTGEWQRLADAPHGRDHTQAAVYDHKLYLLGGRKSSFATKQVFELTTPYVDVYDFRTQQWSTLPKGLNIPLQSAGNMAIATSQGVLVGGGESGIQGIAHNEVYLFVPETQVWQKVSSLNLGRHGSGFAMLNHDGVDYVYTVSGSGNRGGGPELVSTERLALPKQNIEASAFVTGVYEPITLDFIGQDTSEMDNNNPFINNHLSLVFTHLESGKKHRIKGYFAADGDAANTSASKGHVWRAHFTPDQLGSWSYDAKLHYGEHVALDISKSKGNISITNGTGNIDVVANRCKAPDFCALGKISIVDGYFYADNQDKYWLKGGTNSPENLLGFEGFDGTYRLQSQTRQYEASVNTQLHEFKPHSKDWQIGDPVWQQEKGKNLIGLINYLESASLNSAYFLSFNINGDGNDVWPHVSPDHMTRFDVSKLDQWRIVFEHMQRKGVMVHVVLQETENETLLDNGNTGLTRQLYLSEMIARFAHLNGIIWNLGEENGPTHWSPVGQSHAQRKAMFNYLHEHDPYGRPTIIHTHSTSKEKHDILPPLLADESVDGLSFQVDQPKLVNEQLVEWKAISQASGLPWLITMDEVGLWKDGARPDSVDASHDIIRFHTLWGSLMAGGAGVEWYFGAHHPHNDLSAEDLRSRTNIWKQTRIALDFFENQLAYWQMKPLNQLVISNNSYAFGNLHSKMVVYVAKNSQVKVDLSDTKMSYIAWFNPIEGGFHVQRTSLQNVNKANTSLRPPSKAHDWVALIY